MKYSATITSLLMLLAFQSCQVGVDDSLDNNNERQILWISVEGQIGLPDFPAKNSPDNLIIVKVNPSIDFTHIAPILAVSPEATVSPASGEVKDFSSDVTYIVTAPSGLTREFVVRLEEFDEILLGNWIVKETGVMDPMVENYGVEVWPAPGYDVELDNLLSFNFVEINEEDNTVGTLTTDPGPNGQTITLELVLAKMQELAVGNEPGATSATPVHYPEDFQYFWIPATEGTRWERNIAGGTLTFTSGAKSIVCKMDVISDSEIMLTFLNNPNMADFYTRPHNGWADRYDFTYYVWYKLEKVN